MAKVPILQGFMELVILSGHSLGGACYIHLTKRTYFICEHSITHQFKICNSPAKKNSFGDILFAINLLLILICYGGTLPTEP